MNTKSRTATTSHTPGPWHLDKRAASRIVDDHDCTIAVVSHHTVSSYGTFLCNRELMVAAPDMLAAHQENARILGFLVNELQGRIECGKLAAIAGCLDRSAAAISKATGAVGDPAHYATPQTVA